MGCSGEIFFSFFYFSFKLHPLARARALSARAARRALCNYRQAHARRYFVLTLSRNKPFNRIATPDINCAATAREGRRRGLTDAGVEKMRRDVHFLRRCTRYVSRGGVSLVNADCFGVFLSLSFSRRPSCYDWVVSRILRIPAIAEDFRLALRGIDDDITRNFATLSSLCKPRRILWKALLQTFCIWH